MNKVKALLIVLSLLLILNMLGLVAAQDQQFAGVTIDILTFTGPQVAEPLQRRAPDFAELTGATVNIVTVPNSDLYQTMLTDAATGTHSYEGYVFAPQWIVDVAETAYLAALTPSVDADPAIAWDDVAPIFRDFSAT